VKRRERKPEAVTVPPHLAEPFVERYVTAGEVSSLEQAQALAADRHAEEWNSWYAALPTTMISVPVVLDRASLGTEQVDDLVEMTGAPLVGLSVDQGRRLLLGEPFPFRDRDAFEQAIRRGAP